MPSRVVATDSEAKVNGTPNSGVIKASGSKTSDSTGVIAPSPTKDKVDTPTLPSEEKQVPSEGPKIELPTPIPPAPQGDQIQAAGSIETGREGYFDQATQGSASQFLQVLADLQNQFQGKLSDSIEAREIEDDQRSSALNRTQQETRANMRANEETRGREYAEFIGGERDKADSRNKEWEEHQTKMADARKLLDDFYTGEKAAAAERADKWNKFTSDESGKALNRGQQWDLFISGEATKAGERQSAFDNALAQLNQQGQDRAAGWANFIAQEQAAQQARQAQFQTLSDQRMSELQKIQALNATATQNYDDWKTRMEAAQAQAQAGRTGGSQGSYTGGKIPFKVVTNPMTGEKKKIKDPRAKAIAKGKAEKKSWHL